MSAMTKKDFERLAAAMRYARPGVNDDESAWHTWDETVEQITAVCESSNPRFDRARFLAACGVEEK